MRTSGDAARAPCHVGLRPFSMSALSDSLPIQV